MADCGRHPSDPPHNCRRCPRLSTFIRSHRKTNPEWHNGPVATWVPDNGDDDVELLIVGLAPGLKGANRTGLPFTGDASGELLFSMLYRYGWANKEEGKTKLNRAAITNAVRCVPPENRPTGAEVAMCRDRFFKPTLMRFTNLETILTLGKIAHDATARALAKKVSDFPFAHQARFDVPFHSKPITLCASYHCSRYNVNTGRLTPDMFDSVFQSIARSGK